MPAELTTRCLTFRDIFVCAPTSLFMAFADTGRPTDTRIQTRRSNTRWRKHPLLRPFLERVDGGFLFRALQSTAVAYQFHVEANGVTRYGLSHSAIKSVWLPLLCLLFIHPCARMNK